MRAATSRADSPEWTAAAGRSDPQSRVANASASRIVRADVLYDAGRSVNPAIDIGQIEGGYIQGVGWLTSEEVWWDKKGRLQTHAPSTYKIPTCGDLPGTFNVRIWDKGRNREKTIHRSKAVGEPPFMLAISAFKCIFIRTLSLASVCSCSASWCLSSNLAIFSTYARCVECRISDVRSRWSATCPGHCLR